MSSCLLFWSGGKDCAWALHELTRQGIDVAALVTTFDQATRRVPIHNVGIDDILMQAAALNLPLWPAPLPWPCPNDRYGECLHEVLKASGIRRVAFGDLFLEDIRQFRERMFQGTELIFPLWGTPTADLARRIIAAGYRARVVAVDEKMLPSSLVGREFDERFLEDLPPGVDPCGENGEFHTFVYDGPGFRFSVFRS